MSPEEQSTLIESYIASSKFVWDSSNVLRQGETSPWASNSLLDLANADPKLCLQLCQSIAMRDQSSELLERLANGPLVALLKVADENCLSELIALARAALPFRELLSYVWEESQLPIQTWAIIREYSTPE